MSGKKKVKEEKAYTYREIIGADQMTSIALGKLTDLYIPDMAEMNKLIPLILERKKVMEAFEIGLKKIKAEIDEANPEPAKDDETKEAGDKRKARVKALNKKTVELIDQECIFNVSCVNIDPTAMQKALDQEVVKKPTEIKNICTACGALINIVDADRNLLKAGDIALLSPFVKIKKGSKK